MKHSFEAVCEELDHRSRITLGLERIEALLEKLNNPQHHFDTVQVVGTNGKGTTAVTLAAALEVAGHPSGAYLSPHVLSYTERVVMSGGFISEEEFAAGMGRVTEVADREGIPASQFELLTAGALEVFRNAGLEWGVLEAGLGARYDATTAAGSRMVVLTNVTPEHTRYLGESIEEISVEKLAGLPYGGTLVVGTPEERVLRVAREQCEEKDARMVEAGKEEAPGLCGYAARDGGLGLRAAEELLGRGLSVEEREFAVERTRGLLPGRFEIYEVGGVPVVVEGGHNPAGLRESFNRMREAYPGREVGVVFGVLRDKDVESMLSVLEAEASRVVFTRAGNERAVAPARLAEEFGGTGIYEEDTVEALRAMVGEMKREGGVVMVGGSLYAGVSVMRWLREA